MAKKYYQILEVSETATQAEIRKAYYKLAQKWHPDKNLHNKEEAEKRFKEIGEAYGVLGDEELRRKYDSGETGFSYDFGGYDYEAEIKAEVKRKEEELRKARNERIDIELEILKEEMKALDRSSTISGISAAFSFTYPRVFKENLDNKLWEGYQDWMEKVVKMEITIPKGKESSKELRNFKEEMIRAIKEVENKLGTTDQGSRKRNWTNDRIGREKKGAVEMIEELMAEKNLKAQDLGEYSNYQGQIDSLNKTWEIHELRDKIMEVINNWKGDADKSDRKRREEKDSNSPAPTPEPRKDTSGKSSNKDKIDYSKLTREELIGEANRKDLEIDDLKGIIQALETKVSELEEEIWELKKEPRTAEIKQKIEKRETQLQEIRNSLGRINSNNNSNNKFPTGPVVGVVSAVLVAIVLVGALIIRRKRGKRR